MLFEHFETLPIPSEEVKYVILALRGGLMANTCGRDFFTELQRRLRPDSFTSSSIKNQGGFYKTRRELLLERGVSFEPAGVVRNLSIPIKVINTIWPIDGTAITSSVQRE